MHSFCNPLFRAFLGASHTNRVQDTPYGLHIVRAFYCYKNNHTAYDSRKGVRNGSFLTSLHQMLVMFTFIFGGWLLKRKQVLPDNAGSLLSKLESTILLPALILNTFMNKCTLENLSAKSNLIVYRTIILAAITAVAFWAGKKLSPEGMTERIYRYSFIFFNYGFMGNALVLGIFGQDTLFDYMMFTIPVMFSLFL